MIFLSVISTEFLKLRRCKVTWVTLGVYTIMATVSGFFMWILKNPGMAERIGLIGQKAQLAFGGQGADWPTFLTFIVEMGGVGGLLMGSVIATYVFGREYLEGTAKNLLALPIARGRFVCAKIVVTAAWFGCLTFWLLPSTYVVGTLIGLSGAAAPLFLAAAWKLVGLYLMSLGCAMLAAWIAVETRGYFAPFGFAVFTLVLATTFGRTGWGPYIPWSVVGLYSGAAGSGTPDLGWPSYAVVAVTFLIGAALTVLHEVYADNVQ